MTKDIKIGEKLISMTANAATCYRYKMVFKKDLFQLFKNTEDLAIDSIQELAYIMRGQAAKAVDTMSFDDYMIWLEEFDPLDFARASAQIVDVYASQQGTSSTAKKKVDQQSES